MPLKKFKADLLPKMKEISLNVKKDLLTSAMAGDLVARLKGRGIEFEDYRDYTTVDDASRIDWRASQRAQRLLVREYKLNVNFNVFFLVDVSESMLFASTKKLKCEYAAEVVASLFFGVLGSGNAAGFGLFSDGIIKMVKPQLGQKQFHLFEREIKNVKNYGGKKNMGKAIQQTMSILGTRALIFLVSDFIDTADEIGDYLKIVSHVHEMMGVMILDPRDFEIPETSGQLLLQDPFSDETIYVDAREYAKLYKEYNLKNRRLIETIFHQNKAKLVELRTNQPYFNPLMQFFRTSGARWR